MGELVAELEQQHANNAMTALSDGTWELIASDVEPFRASVFFLALGEAVERLAVPQHRRDQRAILRLLDHRRVQVDRGLLASPALLPPLSHPRYAWPQN